MSSRRLEGQTCVALVSDARPSCPDEFYLRIHFPVVVGGVPSLPVYVGGTLTSEHTIQPSYLSDPTQSFNINPWE